LTSAPTFFFDEFKIDILHCCLIYRERERQFATLRNGQMRFERSKDLDIYASFTWFHIWHFERWCVFCLIDVEDTFNCHMIIQVWDYVFEWMEVNFLASSSLTDHFLSFVGIFSETKIKKFRYIIRKSRVSLILLLISFFFL
jgi:hypothetical protein